MQPHKLRLVCCHRQVGVVCLLVRLLPLPREVSCRRSWVCSIHGVLLRGFFPHSGFAKLGLIFDSQPCPPPPGRPHSPYPPQESRQDRPHPWHSENPVVLLELSRTPAPIDPTGIKHPQIPSWLQDFIKNRAICPRNRWEELNLHSLTPRSPVPQSPRPSFLPLNPQVCALPPFLER